MKGLILLVVAFLTAVIVLGGCETQAEDGTTHPQVQQQQAGCH